MISSSTHQTPVTLLLRLRLRTDQEAWRQFVRIYAPLMYSWARRLGFSPDDAKDRVQDAFLLLAEKLPHFRYDRARRFRAWLWTVFLNRCRQVRRRLDILSETTCADLDNLQSDETIAESDESEFRGHLTRSAMELVRTEFPEHTWDAFWRHVALDEPASKVAQDLGISTDVVYQARTRVLRRLRQAFADLLE